MISEADLERLRQALEGQPEIAFAYVFGSAAADQTHPNSDVDLAVGLTVEGQRLEARQDDSGLGWPVWTEVLSAAQTALRREDVDLVLLHRAPPLLADRIARHGRLVLSRDEPHWLVLSKSRYCDLRPLRNLLDAELEQRVRRGAFGRPAPAAGRG